MLSPIHKEKEVNHDQEKIKNHILTQCAVDCHIIVIRAVKVGDRHRIKGKKPNRIVFKDQPALKNNGIRNNNDRQRYGQNRDKYSQRYGQNTDNYRQSNQRRIHFLVSDQKTPEREKIQEETSVKQA